MSSVETYESTHLLEKFIATEAFLLKTASEHPVNEVLEKRINN